MKCAHTPPEFSSLIAPLELLPPPTPPPTTPLAASSYMSTGPLGVHHFGTAGEGIGYNGVALAFTGGRTFTSHDVWAVDDIGARFGAFPSEEIMYVAGGNFPSNDPDPDDDDFNNDLARHHARNATHDIHRLSERLHVVTNRATNKRQCSYLHKSNDRLLGVYACIFLVYLCRRKYCLLRDSFESQG